MLHTVKTTGWLCYDAALLVLDAHQVDHRHAIFEKKTGKKKLEIEKNIKTRPCKLGVILTTRLQIVSVVPQRNTLTLERRDPALRCHSSMGDTSARTDTNKKKGTRTYRGHAAVLLSCCCREDNTVLMLWQYATSTRMYVLQDKCGVLCSTYIHMISQEQYVEYRSGNAAL